MWAIEGNDEPFVLRDTSNSLVISSNETRTLLDCGVQSPVVFHMEPREAVADTGYDFLITFHLIKYYVPLNSFFCLCVLSVLLFLSMFINIRYA